MAEQTLDEIATFDAVNTWYLYLLECVGGSYYAGITNDLTARFNAHQQGKGARYTRAFPPLQILAAKSYPDRSSASVAEAKLKRLARAKKLSFFATDISHE
ncbi:MAG TPA: GIY-YIG nuclease family protein [Methylophilaceae bacterium]|jgi:putative endonuclease